MPGKTLLTTTAAATLIAGSVLAGSMDKATKNIVETAQDAGDFTTLIAAAEAAGLVETLTGEGPYTVFAPTDDAFAALPEGTLDNLLLEQNVDELTAILTYHVVPMEAMSGDLADGQSIETVNGNALTVTIDGKDVKIGDATVAQADIDASNGVIHVIDSVLLPSDG